MSTPAHPVIPDLPTLTRLFYAAPASLGEFVEVAVDDLPPDYRRLLAHNDHMTVAVEEFHRSPVDVRILDRRVTHTHYARKILLTRQSDGTVVQFGIMRVNLEFLPPEVRTEIEREQTPLGRILIEHDVHRRVQLFSLRRIQLGEELRRLFDRPASSVTYGRTAVIDCNGAPAVELLEIVAPLELGERGRA